MLERWILGLATNLRLKLLALALSLGVWAWVQDDEVLEATVPVQLHVELAPHLLPSLDLPASVSVRLRGARSSLRRAQAEGLSLTLDLERLGPGRHDVALDATSLEDLPGTVSVLTVSPDKLQVQLDEAVTRKLALVPVQVGEAAPGYTVSGVRLVPPLVEVRGPKSLVETLREVPTTPIDVSALRQEVEREARAQLPPLLTWPGEPPELKALVMVAPVLERKVMTSVPVFVWGGGGVPEPSQVTVTLEGPGAQLRELRADQVVALVHPPPRGGKDRYEVVLGPREGPRLTVLHPSSAEVQVVRVEPGLVEVRP